MTQFELNNLLYFKKLSKISVVQLRDIGKDILRALMTEFPIYSYARVAFNNDFILLDKFSSIQHLDLRAGIVPEEHVLAIGKYCPLLTHLNLGGCLSVTDSSLLSIIQNGRLQLLGVTRTSITDTTLENLCTFCSSTLQVLDVSSFHFKEGGLVKLVDDCHTLRELSVANGDPYNIVSGRAKLVNRKLRVMKCVLIILRELN